MPTDTPFAPPAEDAATPPSGPLTLLPGGEIPALGGLLQRTMDEFLANIGPYALAGLGFMVVSVPLVLLLILGIYAGVFGFAFVMIGGAIGSAELLPEAAAAPVAIVVQLLSIAGMFATIFGMIGLLNLVLAPLHASTLRAVREQQQGGRKLDFAAPFRTATTDLLPVLTASLVITTLTMIGLFMCYFPALIAAFVLAFAAPLVALHRQGAIAAVRGSIGHTVAHPGFHLVFFAVYFGITLLSGYIPVVGPMFVYALHVRAHRELFGDGSEPVMA